MKMFRKALTLLLTASMLPGCGALAAEVPTLEDAQQYVAERGWMTGTGAGFSPELLVNRATVYEMLWKMNGSPAPSGLALPAAMAGTDGEWYARSAAWAYGERLTTGTDTGYQGERVMTRSEVITVLHRYVKEYLSLDVSVGGDAHILSYSDALALMENASWAVEAYQWACGTGVACLPDGAGVLDYTAPVLRGELAQMLTVMGREMDRQQGVEM